MSYISFSARDREVLSFELKWTTFLFQVKLCLYGKEIENKTFIITQLIKQTWHPGKHERKSIHLSD